MRKSSVERLNFFFFYCSTFYSFCAETIEKRKRTLYNIYNIGSCLTCIRSFALKAMGRWFREVRFYGGKDREVFLLADAGRPDGCGYMRKACPGGFSKPS